MARLIVNGTAELTQSLAQLSEHSGEIAKRAVQAGASVLADEIRRNLTALPEDEDRYLVGKQVFNGVPKRQKKDLLDSLGITPVLVDRKGVYNAHVGFDGYGSTPTEKYPKGLPDPLLANSVESGSSVRRKTPFVRPALRRAKDDVLNAMQAVIDDEIAKMEK